MVLPAGFGLPPLPYLVALLVVLAMVGGLLWLRQPAVTDGIVIALVPWMIAGATGHVLYLLEWLPNALQPLFGLPAVYLTTAAGIGIVWIVAILLGDEEVVYDQSIELFATGVVVAAGGLVGVGLAGLETGGLALVWPAVGVGATVLVTAGVWVVLRYASPDTAAAVGPAGAIVILGHTFDGITTAIGIDVLQGVERSPIADILIEVGRQLPTASIIGAAWVFVLVKIGLAVAIVWLVREYVLVEPSRGRLVLALVAAVGLGPGAYNLLLIVVTA